MTICIAGICDEGRTIITASDQRLTSLGRVSDSCPKLIRVGRSVVLFSGDMGEVDVVRGRLGNLPKGLTASEIAEEVRLGVTAAREANVERMVLRPLGFDFEAWRKNGLSHLSADLQRTLLDDIKKVTPATNFIVAGFDGPLARLLHVYDNVTPLESTRDFVVVGDPFKEVDAFLRFLQFRRALSLEGALFPLFLAKRFAEASSQSVGPTTDMFAITQAGPVAAVPDARMASMNDDASLLLNAVTLPNMGRDEKEDTAA